MTLNEMIHSVVTMQMCKNVYVDLDGTIKPHKFPKEGLWHFDGQFWFLPTQFNSRGGDDE